MKHKKRKKEKKMFVIADNYLKVEQHYGDISKNVIITMKSKIRKIKNPRKSNNLKQMNRLPRKLLI